MAKRSASGSIKFELDRHLAMFCCPASGFKRKCSGCSGVYNILYRLCFPHLVPALLICRFHRGFQVCMQGYKLLFQAVALIRVSQQSCFTNFFISIVWQAVQIERVSRQFLIGSYAASSGSDWLLNYMDPLTYHGFSIQAGYFELQCRNPGHIHTCRSYIVLGHFQIWTPRYHTLRAVHAGHHNLHASYRIEPYTCI